MTFNWKEAQKGMAFAYNPKSSISNATHYLVDYHEDIAFFLCQPENENGAFEPKGVSIIDVSCGGLVPSLNCNVSVDDIDEGLKLVQKQIDILNSLE